MNESQTNKTLSSQPSFLESLGLLLLVFIVMLCSSLLVFLLLGLDFEENIGANDLALSVFISMLITYGVLAFASKNYWFEYFIPNLKFQNNNALLAVALGFAMSLLVLQLQEWLPPEEALETTIGKALDGDFWAVTLVYISAIVIVPFFEEYLFRGILFDSLKHRWGLTVAVLASAIIFTLFHLFEYHQYWVAWFAIFCLALMLAILRYKSQSMLNPILMHATYNTSLLLVGSN